MSRTVPLLKASSRRKITANFPIALLVSAPDPSLRLKNGSGPDDSIGRTHYFNSLHHG